MARSASAMQNRLKDLVMILSLRKQFIMAKCNGINSMVWKNLTVQSHYIVMTGKIKRKLILMILIKLLRASSAVSLYLLSVVIHL